MPGSSSFTVAAVLSPDTMNSWRRPPGLVGTYVTRYSFTSISLLQDRSTVSLVTSPTVRSFAGDTAETVKKKNPELQPSSCLETVNMCRQCTNRDLSRVRAIVSLKKITESNLRMEGNENILNLLYIAIKTCKASVVFLFFSWFCTDLNRAPYLLSNLLRCIPRHRHTSHPRSGLCPGSR